MSWTPLATYMKHIMNIMIKFIYTHTYMRLYINSKAKVGICSIWHQTEIEKALMK